MGLDLQHASGTPAIRPTPPGARAADAAAAVLVALTLWIATGSGSRYQIFDLVITFRRFVLLPYAAMSVLVVRHILWPRPSALRYLKTAHAWILARPDFAAALRASVATRPTVLLVGFFAVIAIGLPVTPNFMPSSDPLANLPARYDAGWYGGIALSGYTRAHTFEIQRNTAFFPAMPLLMRQLGTVYGMRYPTVSRDLKMLRTLWAGVVISIAAFLWAMHYLVRLGRELIGPERAASAALLLAAYPFAVFFSAPYTESLFLLGSLGAFYHFRRGEWLSSSCWGLLVGLTRPNGCFVSVPLAILAAQQVYEHRATLTPSGAFKAAGVRLATAAMPGVGMLAFTSYLYVLTGVWLAWSRSHAAWGRTYQGWTPFMNAYDWLHDEPILHVITNVPFNTLNALGVLFGLALTYPVFRRLGAAWGVFVLINLLPPLFAGGVLSMGRLTSTLFPLFLALAVLLPPRAVASWVAAFAMAQGFCASLFFTWRALY
jgi:hypothetical protein